MSVTAKPQLRAEPDRSTQSYGPAGV